MVKERFGAGFRTYDRLAVVQQRICDELAAMCREYISAAPQRVLEIGAGTGFLTRRLTELYPRAGFVLNDLSDKAETYIGRYASDVCASYLWGDAESVEFPSGQQLVASASTVQWFDDLPAFLTKAARASCSGGVLALATFGPDNFREITAAAGEGLAYHSKTELETMICSAGYELLCSDEYIRTLSFGSPADVLRHIKATGVNSLSRARWTRGRLAQFEEEYNNRFALTDGSVTLTYHPILVMARKA